MACTMASIPVAAVICTGKFCVNVASKMATSANNIGEIIPWKPGEPRKGSVDFGHNSGSSYKEIFEKYRTREITLDELKDFQFNPDNYRLETPSANRSHEYE